MAAHSKMMWNSIPGTDNADLLAISKLRNRTATLAKKRICDDANVFGSLTSLWAANIWQKFYFNIDSTKLEPEFVVPHFKNGPED